MSSKELLKTASKLLISKFITREIELKPTISYQLIAAAFGFWSHESVVDYEIPFEQFNSKHYFGAKPQFNLELLSERIGKLLELDEEKAKDTARLISDIFVYHFPLRVQALKILYEPEYTQNRSMIFRLLNSKGTELTPLASAAIATKLLPALPAQTLAGHLRLMRSVANFMDGSAMTVDEFIQRAPTRIWCYPSPFLIEAFPSLADSAFHVATESDDWVVSDRKHENEIGVGFVLLQGLTTSDGRPAYAVVSGRYVLVGAGEDARWSDVEVVSTMRYDWPNFRVKALADILGHSVELLPLLSHCPVCNELQAFDQDKLPVIRCGCSPS